MVESVLFDLDGTLLDRDTSVKQFIAVQYDRLTEQLSHIPKQDYIDRFIDLDCHGHVWKDKVYQELVVEFVIEGVSWQSLLKDYEMQFQYHCVPFQFLTEMLSGADRTDRSSIEFTGLDIYERISLPPPQHQDLRSEFLGGKVMQELKTETPPGKILDKVVYKIDRVSNFI